jgi:DNA-binding GntR family transcriptional regulator
MLAEFIDMRVVLELHALELAMPNLVREDLESMLEKMERADASTSPLLVDNALHAYFVEKSGNRYIKEFFDRHGKYLELLLIYQAEHPSIHGLRKQAIREHREVLVALLRGDLAGAKLALEAHIRSPLPALMLAVAADREMEPGSTPMDRGGMRMPDEGIG